MRPQPTIATWIGFMILPPQLQGLNWCIVLQCLAGIQRFQLLANFIMAFAGNWILEQQR
jgi:hypothetical protein